MKKKNVKKLLAGATFVALSGAAGVAKYAHDKHKEDVHNNEINTEWKTEFADADSVYADAKTAHFYAHKNLSPEVLEALKKERAELEAQISSELNDIGDDKVELLTELRIAGARGRINAITRELRENCEYEVEVNKENLRADKVPVRSVEEGEWVLSDDGTWHKTYMVQTEKGGMVVSDGNPSFYGPETGEQVKKELEQNSQDRLQGKKIKSIKDKLFDR